MATSNAMVKGEAKKAKKREREQAKRLKLQKRELDKKVKGSAWAEYGYLFDEEGEDDAGQDQGMGGHKPLLATSNHPLRAHTVQLEDEGEGEDEAAEDEDMAAEKEDEDEDGEDGAESKTKKKVARSQRMRPKKVDQHAKNGHGKLGVKKSTNKNKYEGQPTNDALKSFIQKQEKAEKVKFGDVMQRPMEISEGLKNKLTKGKASAPKTYKFMSMV